MRTLFLFSLLSFSQALFATAATIHSLPIQEWSSDIQWIRLLYYQGSASGGWESQIDSQNFFLAPNGKTDPGAEMRADLEAFFNPTDLSAAEEAAAICRFPARYFWLQKKARESFPQLSWPKRDCPRYERWFETLRGQSVSLVFSSYYLNNPSSTFGHTLIRINKAPASNGQRYELLDYGVNFAANANTSNPLIYSVKGLFGGFPGTFSTVPYYYKVREYSNAESRDLWEYELNYSPASTDMLIRNVWELGPSYADYWYLSENCSYFMLALLEAGDPKLELTNKLKKYVIPTDTVQAIYEAPGLVKGYHFRPSVRSELFLRLEALSESEKASLSRLIETRSSWSEIKLLPPGRQRLVLDAAIDDMDYLYPVAVQQAGTNEWKFKNQILAERSQISEITPRIVVPTPEQDAPHVGHGSRRLGLGLLSGHDFGSSLLLNYRFAFHDILDPRLGFPEYAQIVFFDLKFSYEDRQKKLEFDELNLFEVLTLSPYSQFSKSISWRLKVGVERLNNEQCPRCHAFAITGGAGYAKSLIDSQKFVGYLGLKAGIFYTTKDSTDTGFPRWLLGAGPNLTFKKSWSENSITSLEAWYRKDSQVLYQEFKEISLSHQQSFQKNSGIRITGTERWFDQSISFELFHYY